MTYTQNYSRSLSRHRQNRFQRPQRSRVFQRSFSNQTKTLDISSFVKKAENLTADIPYVPTHSFEDFLIRPELKTAIKRRNYIIPTPIQDQAIPYLLKGQDVVGIANTGTGKTAAFLIPLIQKILTNRTERVMIIAPTRELAVQIKEETDDLSSHLGIQSLLCIGGVSKSPQTYGLRKNPNIVIGTPGRLIDLQKLGYLSFKLYESIVLDEVDRMLDMGFIKDIKYIISQLPEKRQSLFFSATLPREIQSVMNTFLKNPVTVSVKTRETSKNVDQDVIHTNGKEKIEILHELLLQEEFSKVLVFGRTKWGMEKLSKNLAGRGFRVAAIHGNKNQSQRQRAIIDFKEHKVQVLLATDIASRGLDIPDVTHVINYDIPGSYEDYVHRIGRTGRAEKTGKALTFIDSHK